MEKCPLCGKGPVYNSGFRIECPTQGCSNFSKKQLAVRLKRIVDEIPDPPVYLPETVIVWPPAGSVSRQGIPDYPTSMSASFLIQLVGGKTYSVRSDQDLRAVISYGGKPSREGDAYLPPFPQEFRISPEELAGLTEVKQWAFHLVTKFPSRKPPPKEANVRVFGGGGLNFHGALQAGDSVVLTYDPDQINTVSTSARD